MKFEKPQLVKECPKILVNKYSLRVYKTKESDNKWRWHFGFPKELVEPLCPLLESTPYWGEQHWYEDEDDFWLWWLFEKTKTIKPPIKKLCFWLKWHTNMYNRCLSFLKKGE